MKTPARTAAVAGLLGLCLPLLGGCSEPPPPPDGEPVKLSPGMEAMKNDMLKAYKNKSLGKVAKVPESK